MSTSKQEDELDAVHSHSTRQGSRFYFSTDPFVKILEIALDQYCHIYDVPFQNLKDMADSDGIQFDNNLAFILTKPPYNVQR